MTASTIPIRRYPIKSPTTLNVSGFSVHELRPNRVESVVSELFGVPLAMLHSRDRHARVADARMTAIALLIQCEGWHPDKAAEYFGRERFVAYHSSKTVAKRQETEPEFAARINACRTRLGA